MQLDSRGVINENGYKKKAYYGLYLYVFCVCN